MQVPVRSKLAALILICGAMLLSYIKHVSSSISNNDPRSNAGTTRRHGKAGKLVVSFSLYGVSTRYSDGAVSNAQLHQWVYPGWEMWVYHDNSVSESVLVELRNNEVKLINMTGSDFNPMNWRFLPASETSVERMCSRDIDARLSLREFAAVSKWLGTESNFLTLRDHPGHLSRPIMGGMWCATKSAVPNMLSILQNYSKEAHFNADQHFLGKVIWPIVAQSTLQIVSHGCDKYPNSFSMPIPRIGLEHIGAVYVSGALRQKDSEMLQNAILAGEECPCCFRELV